MATSFVTASYTTPRGTTFVSLGEPIALFSGVHLPSLYASETLRSQAASVGSAQIVRSVADIDPLAQPKLGETAT